MKEEMEKINQMKNFMNKITSLDNIHQWEERDSVIKESVSQHSFKVSAICVYLLSKIPELDYSVHRVKFKSDCISYSILHDFDEAILGRDISHVVKYNPFNGKKMRKAIDEYVGSEIKKFGFNSLFEAASRDADIKMVCKLCDWLAMLTFIKRNESMGVKTFAMEKGSCLGFIKIKVAEVEDKLKYMFGIECDIMRIINDFIIEDLWEK